MIVISTGCPAGIGPEISVHAAARAPGGCILVGDWHVLQAAAELMKIPRNRLVEFDGHTAPKSRIAVVQAGPRLTSADCRPGKPTKRSGRAQLDYIETAFDLVKSLGDTTALVTAPVSKAVIAHCGLARASHFLGHTEWLEARDGAPSSTMCFTTRRFSTSLVTTHLPISKVPRAITARRVATATRALAQLLLKLTRGTPRIAVCSLNPHAGESSLLGQEESRAIVPGIQEAKRHLKGVELVGPIGAETAYRKAQAGEYQGVVAMYHDQATIPTKLIAFGEAVNVTWGLSVVRTSVDHGTGYDIAWTGKASDKGMLSAISLGRRLVQ